MPDVEKLDIESKEKSEPSNPIFSREIDGNTYSFSLYELYPELEIWEKYPAEGESEKATALRNILAQPGSIPELRFRYAMRDRQMRWESEARERVERHREAIENRGSGAVKKIVHFDDLDKIPAKHPVNEDMSKRLRNGTAFQ